MNTYRISSKSKREAKKGGIAHKSSEDGSSLFRGLSPTSNGPFSNFYSDGPVLRLKPFPLQTQTGEEEESEPVQRQEEPEEDEESIQAKPLSGKPSRLSPGLQSQVRSLGGGGQPLPQSSRAFFEPRFGADFSDVRVHTDSRAAETAASISAKAFTIGKDVVFGSGQYFPGSTTGRKLLAHELAHVVQQKNDGKTRGANVIRRDYWEDWKKSREYQDPKKIPKTFNYELIRNELWAHSVSKTDIDQVVELISILKLYYGEPPDKSNIKKEVETIWQSIKGSGRKSINITTLLPKNLRKFLAELKEYHKKYNDYIANNKVMPGKDRMDIIIYYGKKKEKAQTKEEEDDLEAEKLKKIKEWSEKAPKSPDEKKAACHNFLMMVISGSPAGSKPGRYIDPAEYEKSLSMDLDKIRAAYETALKGEGPFRIVPKSDVKIGDIAVFRDKSGFITHSALVIKVSGGEVEVLEKINPDYPMATRTVGEIVKGYSKEIQISVSFLTPALEGMPGKSPKGLGWKPPTDKYKTAEGKAPENTHVLFKVNTNVTLPHEDRKLFAFLNTYKKPVEFNVHGYASIEGSKKYNLNLSAHRAVAVKKALLNHLVPGSKSEAFARGRTTAFGPKPQNRRAGIELKKTAQTEKEETEHRTGSSRETGFKPPYSTYADLLKLKVDPRYIALPPSFLEPPGEASSSVPTLDYLKLGNLYRKRGYAPTSKDWSSIEQLWMKNYSLFNSGLRFSPEIAKLLSDFTLSFYVDQHLYLQRPTEFEKFEQKYLEQPKMLQIEIFELIRLFGTK